MKATIARPFYDWDGRKYMELRMDDTGNVLRTKVPWRYNRVMCRVHGIRPIQEFESSESVDVIIEKKIWNGETHWILASIRSV